MAGPGSRRRRRARLVFAGQHPWASGDQTIWPMPNSAQRGKISFSGFGQSKEYCGWLDTNRTTPVIYERHSNKRSRSPGPDTEVRSAMNFFKSMVMPPESAIMKLQIQTVVKIEPWHEPGAN